MSTTNQPLEGSTVRLVNGPANVTISMKNGVGEYFIMDAASPGQPPPTPDQNLFGSFLGQQPASMALEADQSLDVRGWGLVVVQSKERAS
ncbi:MAG: hypothetical protein AAF317_13805 [Pseudomonadota bacterium]|mgnify:CR=1 FL=1